MASLDGHWWCWHTAAGNLRRAKLGDVCGWVKRSWKGISTEIIINSFKTCGISNTLDDIGDSDKEIEGDLEITDISDLENDISDFENDVSDDNLEDN